MDECPSTTFSKIFGQKKMNIDQCRAARALLNLSQDELAKRSNVSIGTIKDWERGKRIPMQRTLDDLKRALEEMGIVFSQSEAGYGVWRAASGAVDQIEQAEP